MVLVGVGAQRRQDRRVDVGLVAREQRLVAEVHQRLVGVVAQELLDVLGQVHPVVKILGVLDLVVVELEEQLIRVVLEFLAGRLVGHRQPALVLVADVVAVHRLVADDQPDHVGGVGELGPAAPVHRQIEARVEQEALQQRGGHLALERLVTLVVLHDDLGLALQVGILLGPAERLVDLLRRAQGGEDVAVAAGVHRLHERDVGVHRFLVRGQRVGDQADRAHGALDGVQQRQPGEHPHRELLLMLGQRVPRRDVVGHRHLLRQPEVTGEAIPDLGVLVVLQAVPVDGRDAVDQFDAITHENPISPGFLCDAAESPTTTTTLQLVCDISAQYEMLCLACRLRERRSGAAHPSPGRKTSGGPRRHSLSSRA